MRQETPNCGAFLVHGTPKLHMLHLPYERPTSRHAVGVTTIQRGDAILDEAGEIKGREPNCVFTDRDGERRPVVFRRPYGEALALGGRQPDA